MLTATGKLTRSGLAQQLPHVHRVPNSNGRGLSGARNVRDIAIPQITRCRRRDLR